MDCCQSNQCRGIESVFDTRHAERNLADYHRDGPNKMTATLLEAVRGLGVRDASLMDVGGGIGAIQHELVKSGVSRVVNVDASSAYSHIAKQEAERQGYADRADYHVGDFVQLAPQIETVDILTMDRVICCYDDVHGLVNAAVTKARRVIGLIYPTESWLARTGVGVINLYQTITRNPFRVFVHPAETVDGIVRDAGFSQTSFIKGLFWQVVVYARSA